MSELQGNNSSAKLNVAAILSLKVWVHLFCTTPFQGVGWVDADTSFLNCVAK